MEAANRAEGVRSVLEAVFDHLDAPILNYLVGVIADGDGGPTRPLQDDILPILLSAGIDDSTDGDAEAICNVIEQRLRSANAGYSGGGQAFDGALSPLDAPVRLEDVAAVVGLTGDESCIAKDMIVRSRMFGDDDRSLTEKTSMDGKWHDGVSLNRRKLDFDAPTYGLRAFGAARERKKNPCGMERPLLANGQIKLEPRGAKPNHRSSAAATCVLDCRILGKK